MGRVWRCPKGGGFPKPSRAIAGCMVLGALGAISMKDLRHHATQAYGALWAILGVGMLPVMRSHSIVDLPYFIGLAVVTIYVGAHRGLNSKQRQTISIEQVQRPFSSTAPSQITLRASYTHDRCWLHCRVRSPRCLHQSRFSARTF